ncbi:hypothetical protein TNCV_4113511 [Trichonephila clavipes]|nr:hypothetical protein TNCV_4113511 [Trichonephila clavipes]
MEAGATRITSDTLSKVWDEFAFRLDVCRVTNGVHIEHLGFSFVERTLEQRVTMVFNRHKKHDLGKNDIYMGKSRRDSEQANSPKAVIYGYFQDSTGSVLLNRGGTKTIGKV